MSPANEILSWMLFIFAIFLNIFNFLLISHHGYLVKEKSTPKPIKRTELRRYFKFIVFLGIIIFALLSSAYLINCDIGKYIFGGFLIKLLIHISFWVYGFFRKINNVKASVK